VIKNELFIIKEPTLASSNNLGKAKTIGGSSITPKKGKIK